MRACLFRDDGSAPLEFMTVGLLLLVPLVYLVLVVSTIQGGALAAEGAARQAARVYVQARSTADAAARARTAIRFALADFGIPASRSTMQLSCTPKPRACLARHGSVEIRVRVAVPLPLMPDALNLGKSISVTLQAEARQQVSRFAGAR